MYIGSSSMIPTIALRPPCPKPMITPAPTMPSNPAAGMPSTSPSNTPSSDGVWQSILLLVLASLESLLLEAILLGIRCLKRDIETAASRMTNITSQPRQVAPFGSSPCTVLPALCCLLLLTSDDHTAYNNTMAIVTSVLGLITLVASIHAIELGTRDLRKLVRKSGHDSFDWAKSLIVWTYDKAKAWLPKIADVADVVFLTCLVMLGYMGYSCLQHCQLSTLTAAHTLLYLIGIKALLSAYPVVISAFWHLAPEEDLYRNLKRAIESVVHVMEATTADVEEKKWQYLTIISAVLIPFSIVGLIFYYSSTTIAQRLMELIDPMILLEILAAIGTVMLYFESDDHFDRFIERAVDKTTAILDCAKDNGRKFAEIIIAFVSYLAFAVILFGCMVVLLMEIAMDALRAKEVPSEVEEDKSDQATEAAGDQEATETFEDGSEFEEGNSDEGVVEQAETLPLQEPKESEKDDVEEIEDHNMAQRTGEPEELEEPEDKESVDDSTSSDCDEWVVV